MHECAFVTGWDSKETGNNTSAVHNVLNQRSTVLGKRLQTKDSVGIQGSTFVSVCLDAANASSLD